MKPHVFFSLLGERMIAGSLYHGRVTSADGNLLYCCTKDSLEAVREEFESKFKPSEYTIFDNLDTSYRTLSYKDEAYWVIKYTAYGQTQENIYRNFAHALDFIQHVDNGNTEGCVFYASYVDEKGKEYIFIVDACTASDFIRNVEQAVLELIQKEVL